MLQDSDNLEAWYVDDRILDVYVDPGRYQDVSKVNLTWYAVSLDEEQLKLQIIYHNCEYISIEGLDKLVVEFMVKDAFLSQSDGQPLYYRGYKVSQKIRKQLPPGPDVVNMIHKNEKDDRN